MCESFLLKRLQNAVLLVENAFRMLCGYELEWNAHPKKGLIEAEHDSRIDFGRISFASMFFPSVPLRKVLVLSM